MDILFFVVFTIALIALFVRPKKELEESALEIMRKKCIKKPLLHVFIDAGIDDPHRSMECVCRALDASDCPESLNVYVIIPTSSFRRSTWETSLEAMCTAYPRYNTFFESNVHLYKMSSQHYGTGGLHVVGTILNNLETISAQDLVVWLPPLIKLDEGWDTSIVHDWTAGSVLSYPMQQVPSLEQNIEGYLLRRENKSSPCYYFIDSSLQLGCRPQVKPHLIESNYLSLFYPLIATKEYLLLLTKNGIESICDDLDFSFRVQNTSKIYVGSRALGFTYRKGAANPIKNLWKLWESQEFKKWAEKIGIEFCEEKRSIKVLLHGSMGTVRDPLLTDKITRWGTEVKYESFREELLYEEQEEKD
jgi:hypothetical protein